MSTTQDILANTERLNVARRKRAQLEAKKAAAAAMQKAISNIGYDAERALEPVIAEIQALELGAGPGVTDGFGEYSTLEQAMKQERFAGKAASIEFVKANPECTAEEAQAVYVQAALAARPVDRQYLLINPDTLRDEYSANLVKYGMIQDATWESWRAWIIATPTEVIMGIN